MKRGFTTTVASAAAIVFVFGARGWPPDSLIDAFTALFLALGIAILAALVAEKIPITRDDAVILQSKPLHHPEPGPEAIALPDPLDYGLEPPLI